MRAGNQTTSDREALGFAEAVRSAFAFLRQYGFAEIEAAPTIVRFASGDVGLTLYHGRSSYEVGAEIGLRGSTEPGYTLSEVIRLADPAEGAKYRNLAVTTKESVRNAAATVASLLKKFGEAALIADSKCFSRLEDQRRAWSESYALDVLADQVLPRADEAFRQGRYAEAADLYERIRPRLSPAETKKLDLAKRRASKEP